MTRKEWREVATQSLYFLLAATAMALLVAIAGRLQAEPFSGEKAVIMLGLWLLVFSMFLGLSPFAMDSKQQGMEYLLTLPLSRRRLLFIKLLPRLAAVVLFYLAYVVLYVSLGDAAFGGGFAFFSLAYFALFFISFSLSVVHENFIVQSIWAAIALSGHLALCLFVVMQGFSWKFRMPAAWVGSSIWHNLAYDVPTLIAAIAVFVLMAAPFLLSIFIAFKKFDLKPAPAFNRRHLLTFLPLLLVAFGISLGLTYFVQGRFTHWDPQFFILKDQRLLEAGFPGKLDVHEGNGRHRTDTRLAAFWDRRPLSANGDRVYLNGYDTKDGSQFIGSLNLADLSWKELHRFPHGYVVSTGSQEIHYDGECFVYLKRSQTGAERPGMVASQTAGSGILEMARIDPASGGSRTITFRHPLFRRYSGLFFIGSDEQNHRRFWLISHQGRQVLRLWDDGRVEDLGVSRGLPAFAGGLLFTRGDNSLQVRRLLAAGSEAVKEIAGKFNMISHPYFFAIGNARCAEIYAERDKRIVRIDLATLAVDDVGPRHGHIWKVSSGEFYYVEFESWPGQGTDRWKKLYHLQGGRMILLKQFDFGDAGYGHVWVDANGIILRQQKIVNKESKTTARFFAFPDLMELKFKDLK
jgi:hypothetical protein